MHNADLTAEPDVTAHAWEIRAERVEVFKSKIEQANRKLERAGLDARFEVTYTDFEKRFGLTSGAEIPAATAETVFVTEPWVRAEMSGPLSLAHGHFTFVAALVPEEAGITVHSAPGQELDGFVPRGDNACEHCGVARNRTRLYLVRDERTGAIIQLGHTCIEMYTGVSPKGLWALTYDDTLAEIALDRGGPARRPLGASVNAVLAYAYAHSDQGRSYQAATGWGVSTGGQVRMSLFGSIHRLKEADRAYYVAKAAESTVYAADTTLMDAIKSSVDTTDVDSDYGRNLRVILGAETVTGRNIGILASLVKVYARAKQLEVERAATVLSSGFIGEVGERIKNITARAKTVVYNEGMYGTTTFLVAITDTGHTLVWGASKSLDVAVGDWFTIAAATVKEHGEFNGIDQTVIARPSKFTVLHPETAAA